MANLKHMDIIKRGIDSWNTWRINNSHIQPSLSDAGLHMAYLNKAISAEQTCQMQVYVLLILSRQT